MPFYIMYESMHPKSKFINSPEPTYFEHFDMRYPVEK